MNDLERLSVDAIRVLSMDAVQQANSGHPGTPMALAPVGYVLFRRQLRHSPANPAWIDRDRFVLSVGHASMLMYSLLHLSGYDVTEEDIRNFRQWGSPTAGHPEYGHVPGVETTTGPLGQGVANSVGFALAERWLASHFNRPDHDIVDHYTCFLDGLETGSIDYDNRARDGSVETDRSAAAAAMSAVVDRLLAIDVSARDRELAVHMDCGGGPDEAGLRGRSSVQRELQFLVSHTVHHYALVAVMLRLEGREPFDGFGVSPSTLKYQETAR